jgi:release factor glutamine methyltransferase
MSQTFAQLRADLSSALSEFLDPSEARAESLRWFEEGLAKDRAWLLSHGEDLVSSETHDLVFGWLKRRRQGEPWAYILGWTTFRGHRFAVDASVLIPRPETELVLEAALETGRAVGVDRACDIGTGSGILAVCMALETDWRVCASDLSLPALQVAKRNAAQLEAVVDFLGGSLLDPVPDPLGLVVSNPPYVDSVERGTLQRELAFEPAMSLFAPDQGLALSTELLHQAWQRKARACVLEIGAGQGPELFGRAKAMGWTRIEIRKDWAEHDRVLIVVP